MKDETPVAKRLTSPGIEPTGEPVRFSFDGSPVEGFEGESLAAALTAAGILALRHTKDGAPRGVFCGMGVCFDCLVTVNGRPGQRACLTKVEAGLRVHSRAPAEAVATAKAPPLARAPDGPIPVHQCQILVIGAGPGGLAAAEAAARGGAGVTVLDERPEAGGQYFKQLAPSQRFSRPSAIDRQFARGRDLIERVRGLGVEMVGGATVWGATWIDSGGVEVDVLHADRALRYRAAQLIVATGAFERAFPVPGWTLPGFMTTGAAQTLGRAYRVAPGSRVLIAGNGPLNLQVACELAHGGFEVVAVAEAAPAPGAARAGAILKAFYRSPDLMAQGLSYLATLRRLGVPVLHGHVLARAEGAGRVQRATLARVDKAGKTISEQTYQVDAVCSGYGFAPSTEITRLLGCRHRFDGRVPGALVVERDGDAATSRPGVFAVGDCGGIGGARVALSQGTLAGWAAVCNLGRSLSAEERSRIAKARRALARELAFQDALWRLFEAPPGAEGRLDDAVPVCRCEEVTAATLKRCIAGGVDEIGALKKVTRAGMGHCQGRYCGPRIAHLCATATGRAPDEFALFAPRFPLKPVPVIAPASEKPEWSEQDQGMAPPAPAPHVRTGAQEIQADVIVIGAGILGTCSAYHLARDGLDVVLLERGQPNGGASGSNAGSLHVQLLSYDFGERAQAGGLPAAEALPLHRDSAKLWPDLARDLDRDLEIKITGGLMVAEDGERFELLKRKTELERRYGIPAETISAAELRELAPAVSEHMVGAAWCPEEGKINPMLATPAVLDGALAAGARLYKETEVQDIERLSGGFLVRTSRGTFRAAKVLNACGGWASRVAAMVGLRLPTRANPIQLIVTEPAPPLIDQMLAHADRHLTLKQVTNGNFIIGGGWRAGLDADTLRPQVLRDSFEGNLWIANRVVPALASVLVLRSWAAMNVAIDGAPIIGEAPGVPGFYNAVTVNGVTLGPLIGRLTAEMIRSGRARPELAPFTLARFG
ncbi:MAG: FAD-dependent oxidoreductase [Rhodospirillales bacterium]|jgi:glycine/D-amino acid oxidase-like deaminating enzyme/NADPH-dependent 2,4-dienoyl-CoA reductase/sulfur reductase-like enzyme|nr:FAD-dependent oxidoreductase [Rhodospirillales bacterium]